MTSSLTDTQNTHGSTVWVICILITSLFLSNPGLHEQTACTLNHTHADSADHCSKQHKPFTFSTHDHLPFTPKKPSLSKAIHRWHHRPTTEIIRGGERGFDYWDDHWFWVCIKCSGNGWRCKPAMRDLRFIQMKEMIGSHYRITREGMETTGQ